VRKVATPSAVERLHLAVARYPPSRHLVDFV